MSPSHNQQSPISPASGTVLPLLADAENQRLLTEWLAERHDVLAGEPASICDGAFDLCIVDDQALAEHHATLTVRKESEKPAFLPYLLVTRRQDEAKSTPQVQRLIDDLLRVPTTKKELAWRVSNLLNRRQLSIKLRRLKEQSEERFRLLFQAAPDPVVVVSSNGLISNANKAFYNKFGFEESDLTQTRFDDLGFIVRETNEESDAKQTNSTVYWEQDRGDPLVMDVHISKVEFDNNITEYIGIFRNITETANKIDELEEEQKRLKGLHWSRR